MFKKQYFLHTKKYKTCWFCDDKVPGLIGICNNCACERKFKFRVY